MAAAASTALHLESPLLPHSSHTTRLRAPPLPQHPPCTWADPTPPTPVSPLTLPLGPLPEDVALSQWSSTVTALGEHLSSGAQCSAFSGLLSQLEQHMMMRGFPAFPGHPLSHVAANQGEPHHHMSHQCKDNASAHNSNSCLHLRLPNELQTCPTPAPAPVPIPIPAPAPTHVPVPVGAYPHRHHTPPTLWLPTSESSTWGPHWNSPRAHIVQLPHLSFSPRARPPSLQSPTTEQGEAETPHSALLLPLDPDPAVEASGERPVGLESPPPSCSGSGTPEAESSLPPALVSPKGTTEASRGTSGCMKRGRDEGEQSLAEDDVDEEKPDARRKLRRLLSNRASAKRSRERKQGRLQELEISSAKLRVEHAEMVRRFGEVRAQLAACEKENRKLREEIQNTRDGRKSSAHPVKENDHESTDDVCKEEDTTEGYASLPEAIEGALREVLQSEKEEEEGGDDTVLLKTEPYGADTPLLAEMFPSLQDDDEYIL